MNLFAQIEISRSYDEIFIYSMMRVVKDGHSGLATTTRIKTQWSVLYPQPRLKYNEVLIYYFKTTSLQQGNINGCAYKAKISSKHE